MSKYFKLLNLLLVVLFTTIIYSCDASKEDLDTGIRIKITPSSLDLSNVIGDVNNCKDVSAKVFYHDEEQPNAKLEFSIDKENLATVFDGKNENSKMVCGSVSEEGLANLVVKATIENGKSSVAHATVSVKAPGSSEIMADENRAIRIEVTPISLILNLKEEASKCIPVSAALVINGEKQKNEVKLSVVNKNIATLDSSNKLCGVTQGFTNLIANATYQDKDGKDQTIIENTPIVVSDGAIEKDAINFSYNYPDASNRKIVEFIAELPKTDDYKNATLTWSAKNVVSSGAEENVSAFNFKDDRFIYTFSPKSEGGKSQDTFKVSLTVTKKGSIQETITKTIYVSDELVTKPINLNFTYKEIGNGWVEFYVNIKDKNVDAKTLNFQIEDKDTTYSGTEIGKNVVYVQYFKNSDSDVWDPNREVTLLVYDNNDDYSEEIKSTIHVNTPPVGEVEKPNNTAGEKITISSSERAFRTTLTATRGANDLFESFEWAFGDGVIISDKNISPTQEHIYARPGNYEVTLLAKAYDSGSCPQVGKCPTNSQISKYMVRIPEDKTFINKLPKPTNGEVYIAFYITGISASNKFKDTVKNGDAFPRTVDLMFENQNSITFGATKDKYTEDQIAYKAGYSTQYGYGDKNGKTLQVPYYIAEQRIKASRSNPTFSFRNFAIVDPTKSLLGAQDFDRISFIRMNEAMRLTFNVDFSRYDKATDKDVALFEVNCVASKDNPQKPCVTKFIKFDKIDK